VDGAYYLSLFYSCLVALAAFSIAYDAPSSLLLSGLLGLGAFWATFLSSLVFTRHERVVLRYSLRVRRLAKKLKRKVWPRRMRPGFNQTS
jgi:hypothetical protein